MSESTPTPWRIDRDNAGAIEIVGDDGNLVFIEKFGDLPRQPEGTAEEIIAVTRANFYRAVVAVNSHGDLLAALKDVRQAFRDNDKTGTEQHPWIPGADAERVLSIVKAAIAKAEGK